MLASGERTITLERLVNIMWGLKPEMDTLPPKLLETPISDGPRKGERIDRTVLVEMLKQYYLLRGWDPETGAPYKETLAILGIDTILNSAPTTEFEGELRVE